MLYKGSQNYSMNSCEIIELFYNIRIDIDKLKYASYITKIINDVTTENQNNYKILQLFLNTLYVISETDKDLDLIMSIFRLRMLSLIGYRPVIDKCKGCNETENLEYFSFKDSGFKCKACAKQDTGAMQITETTRDAIRYIVLAEAKKIYSFNIPDESKKELEIISQIYLREKLEKEYKS